MTRISIGPIELNVVQCGTGRPLLLVHGFPLDHQMWKGQITDLAEDFHVIAPDLRGFGLSDSHGDTVRMEQFADDLALLLDRLTIDQPIICADCRWVGTSPGSSGDAMQSVSRI